MSGEKYIVEFGSGFTIKNYMMSSVLWKWTVQFKSLLFYFTV